ncbi:MAG: TerC family protein [Bdellovibrionales bacterium]|nr:TerC family protein [Bdellovibrionales bacterium]
MEWIISLLILTALEIILGIDNIVLISITTSKLPPELKPKARKIGLTLALVMRILMLSLIAWMIKLTQPIFEVFNHALSMRDLILIVGGMFLVAKATLEIYEFVEASNNHQKEVSAPGQFAKAIWTIVMFDLIFSLDSVLTAVGLVKEVWIMIAAVIIAVIFMIIFVDQISEFVEKSPSIRILALSFLVLIGVLLLAEGFGQHFNRNFVYFAMVFSLLIDFLTKRHHKNREKPS